MNNLQIMCRDALTRHASRQAIEFDGKWYTYGDVQGFATKLQEILHQAGVESHAPVAFVARNRPCAVATLLALLAEGHTIRMIYAFQSPAGIARTIEMMKPAAIIAIGQDFSDEVCAMLRSHAIAAIAIEDMDAHILPGFETARKLQGSEIPQTPQIEILTSGTTGPPKHFSISYDMIAKHHVGDITPKPGQPDPTTLTPAYLYFPLGNITGIYVTVPAILRGLRLTLADRFTVAGWVDFVKRYRPTATGLPPAGVQMVLDANIPAEDLSSIKAMGTGAAPLDPTVQRAFEERYHIPILLSYGATEFGGPVAAMTAELYAAFGQAKFGSVGRAMPGATLRIIDPVTGAVLPPGQEGILEVVSPRIGPDWIRTSDVAVIDEDGFLFHRGRADGAIMRGGFKILPETIERALLLHPAVSAASVVAVADKRLSQVPGAAIEIKPNMPPPSIDELAAHLRGHVLATHIPVHWRFVKTLPKTGSFKISRPAVQQLFADSATS